MARLKLLKDGIEMQSIDLAKCEKTKLVLGRGPGSDLRIDDRAVGREHALLTLGPNGVSIQKKSRFGKLAINGAELEKSPLKAGDVISIADYLLRLEDEFPVAEGAGESSIGGRTLDLALPSGDPAEGEPGISPLEVPLAEKSDEALALEAASVGVVPVEDGAAVDEKTAVLSKGALITKLVFKPGEASVEEILLKKDETILGRGSGSDVILHDKKASRKHLSIKKAGMSFLACDLGSGNGTYVNGARITEQELSSDDVLRIGETEFVFKAINKEYFEQEGDFMQVPPAEGELNGVAVVETAPSPELAGLQAVPGLGGSETEKKKETLLDKFKRQPKPRQIMILMALAALLFFVFFGDEEDQKAKKKDKPVQQVEKTDAAFSALPPEKQQFIQNNYQLALDHYKNKQYEQAVLLADRILEVLPSGYKDTRDIKAYAQKSIEIMRANEEERRRKEREEKLRNEVAELVGQAQILVDQGKDEEAKAIFAQVLEKDPDNPSILRLRQQIEEKEQRRKAEADDAREREFKKRQLEAVLKESQDLLRAGRLYEAIEKLQDARVIFAAHPKLLAQARRIADEARRTLKERARPHLEAGKKALADQNYAAARDAFYQALKADPRNAEARKGLDKIREILRERAQRIYTDAVILESVSDFKGAMAKYKECLDQSMPDDIYHGRCLRKWKRFDLMERGATSAPASAAPSGDPAINNTDPQEPMPGGH